MDTSRSVAARESGELQGTSQAWRDCGGTEILCSWLERGTSALGACVKRIRNVNQFEKVGLLIQCEFSSDSNRGLELDLVTRKATVRLGGNAALRMRWGRGSCPGPARSGSSSRTPRTSFPAGAREQTPQHEPDSCVAFFSESTAN